MVSLHGYDATLKRTEIVMSKDDQRKQREAAAFQARIERHAQAERRNIERIQRMQNKPRST